MTEAFEINHFDSVSVAVSGFTSVRDAIQVSYRCRTIKSNIINVVFLDKFNVLSCNTIFCSQYTVDTNHMLLASHVHCCVAGIRVTYRRKAISIQNHGVGIGILSWLLGVDMLVLARYNAHIYTTVLFFLLLLTVFRTQA